MPKLIRFFPTCISAMKTSMKATHNKKMLNPLAICFFSWKLGKKRKKKENSKAV